MKKYIVAHADDVPPGERILVEVNGHSIGVFNVDGNYYALLNRCPHQGARLCTGAVVNSLRSVRPGEFEVDPSRKYITCPWHGWEFDLATGQSYVDPVRTRVRPYPVHVELVAAVTDSLPKEPPGGDDHVKGPYVADTMQVSVESEYLVVTLSR